MPETVFLNGEFVPAPEARISVFDHGFLYGDGIFETMRSYSGRVFLLSRHLDRLFGAARALRLEIPYARPELEQALDELVALNGENLYIRLTVSRGPGPVGIDPGLCPRPTVVITAREVRINDRLYHEGSRVIFTKTLRNLAGATMPEVKSLNFLNNILAKQEVIRAGADEGFMLNYRGQVTEGTVSNVFLVTKGRVMTPGTDCGLLPGITRQKVIELALEAGLQVEERALYREDFAAADEVFYTNSGSEIVPAAELDKHPVGSGMPGDITLKLLADYRSCAVKAG